MLEKLAKALKVKLGDLVAPETRRGRGHHLNPWGVPEMSRPSVAPKTRDPEPLRELLATVETTCGRAADVLRAAGRVVIGEPLDPKDGDVASVLPVALTAMAEELDKRGEELTARMAGGAA